MKHTMSGQASPDIAPEGFFNIMAGRVFGGKEQTWVWTVQSARRMLEYLNHEVHMGNLSRTERKLLKKRLDKYKQKAP